MIAIDLVRGIPDILYIRQPLPGKKGIITSTAGEDSQRRRNPLG